MSSYAARTKELFRKYGRVGIGVHVAVYAATLTGFYLAAENHSKLEEVLVSHGLLSRQDLKESSDPEKASWFSKTIASSGSSLALAFLCTKAVLPIRVPLTIAITPPLARVLRARKAPTSSQP